MKNDWFYKFIRVLLTPLFKLLYRPTYINNDSIPKNGRIVLAGNHTNFLDWVFLLSSTKRTARVLCKEEILVGPIGFLIKSYGVIPVNRGAKDGKALNAAVESLNKDEAVLIFPEGTIAKDRKLLPFKFGAVKMAYESKSKIIPFVIKGKYRIFRKGLSIKFLEPIKISKNLELSNEKLRKKIEDELGV